MLSFYPLPPFPSNQPRPTQWSCAALLITCVIKVFQRCLNGYKKKFWRWKKKCFHSGFTVTKKVFRRCFNGYKKVVSTVKKGVFPQCFYGEKEGVSTVFPWWCLHLENKRCLATVTSLNGTSYYGVSTVTKRVVLMVKNRRFHSSFTVKKEEHGVCTVFQRWQKKVVSTVKRGVNKFFFLRAKKKVFLKREKKYCFYGEKRGFP